MLAIFILLGIRAGALHIIYFIFIKTDFNLIRFRAFHIGKNAHIGAAPDGTDGWGVATCGPDITIREGAVVGASAMIYTGEEV